MRKTSIVAVGVLGLCLAFVVPVNGAIIPVFSTGVDNNGNPLPARSADSHYALTVNPQGGNGPYATDTSGYPFINPAHADTIWIANTSTSQWISPQPSYTSDSNDASGDYTYQTTFTMAGRNPSTASISGQFAVDANLVGVILNGVSLGIDGFSQTSFTPFTISSNFVQGINTLDFIVFNNVQDTGNTTGIQIQMTGAASPIPEPGSLLLLTIGTLVLGRRKRRNNS